MVIWDGACHVHEQFSVEKLVELKRQYPQAKVLAHPECRKPLLMLADKVGSTKALLDYAISSPCTQFIVATESGILHQMQLQCPDKEFIPVPPNDSTCACNNCSFMKLNTLEKIARCLETLEPQIHVDETLAAKARRPIDRMLQLSK